MLAVDSFVMGVCAGLNNMWASYKMSTPTLYSTPTLLLVLEVCNVKPTHRKSWAGNLLMCSDLTLGSSFKVKQGKQNLKVLVSHLLLVLEACNVKPTYRKSLAGNLLMWSDLTLSPSFKVK